MKITFGRLGMLFFLFLLTSCASTLPLALSGQTVQSPSGEDAAPAAAGASASAKEDAEDDGLPTIASVVEGAARFAGFFDLYQSSDDGAVYLRIPTDNLDQELIYTATVTDGVVETGLFRGQYRDNKLIKLQRHFNRIDIVQPNTRFYFDPQSPLSRAADANAPDAVLAVMEIVAEDPAQDDQSPAVLV